MKQEESPSSPGKVPSYPGHWWRGSFSEYRLDPLGFYVGVRESCGDYCKIRMRGGRTQYLLSHPDAVEHVLQKCQENYDKPKERKILFEGSILTSEKSLVKEKRKILQSSYSKKASLDGSVVFADSAQRFIREKEKMSGGAVNLHEEMTQLTLQIASKAMFSHDLSQPELRFHEAVEACLLYSNELTENPFSISRAPWSPLRRSFIGSRRKISDVIDEIIHHHMNTSPPPEDILSQVIERAPSGFNLHENSFLLLLASYLTMSLVLVHAFQQLARVPALQSELLDEIDGRLKGETPSGDDVDHLPLTKSVFMESMRLFPNFNLMHTAKVEDVIGGYAIPRGARVCLSSYVTHRHPEFWDEPETFRPERFLSSDVLKHKFAYFPFGGGPRICLGKSFAMIEGPLVLASIVQRLSIHSANEPGESFVRMEKRKD